VNPGASCSAGLTAVHSSGARCHSDSSASTPGGQAARPSVCPFARDECVSGARDECV
jgi:hypothetical protein